DRQCQPQPQPRMLHAGEDGDAARHAVHSDDRKIELPDQHGQPEPQRYEPDGGEDLQRAVGGRRAEEATLPPVDDSEHDDAGGAAREWPRVRPVEMAPRSHRAAPRACSTITASTITPAARYCHSWRRPLSSSMTCTAAITIAPAKVRSAEPCPPPIAVPPTS